MFSSISRHIGLSFKWSLTFSTSNCMHLLVAKASNPATSCPSNSNPSSPRRSSAVRASNPQCHEANKVNVFELDLVESVFFHKCGRRVGGVHWKGRKHDMMRGKRTQATQKQAKTHQTKTKTRNRKTTTARGRFPLIKARFLCTRVRHVKTTKADC